MSRELDQRIAVEVMGVEPRRIAIATKDGGKSAGFYEDAEVGRAQVVRWIAETGKALGYSLGEWIEYKPYSTSIEAAWEVVEKMRKDGYSLTVMWDGKEWGACFVIDTGSGAKDYDSAGETAPKAICLAALSAATGKGE